MVIVPRKSYNSFVNARNVRCFMFDLQALINANMLVFQILKITAFFEEIRAGYRLYQQRYSRLVLIRNGCAYGTSLKRRKIHYYCIALCASPLYNHLRHDTMYGVNLPGEHAHYPTAHTRLLTG